MGGGGRRCCSLERGFAGRQSYKFIALLAHAEINGFSAQGDVCILCDVFWRQKEAGVSGADVVAVTEQSWRELSSRNNACPLYTSDAADDLTRVDSGGCRFRYKI